MLPKGGRLSPICRPSGSARIVESSTTIRMPQSFSRVLVHLVFSTKNREPLIQLEIQEPLHNYMAGTLSNLGCGSVRIGGVEDHVHLLFGLSRTHTMAEVVENLKTSSSKWLKEKGPTLVGFHWQSGYGAFSVSQSDVETVTRYIENQREHHKRMTFKEEFIRLLERYQLTYDERYVWD
jgi:putative transposase